MSMDRVFGIAGSALAAQLVRMNTTASNLANASNTAETEQGAYKAKRVVFRTLLQDQEVGSRPATRGRSRLAMSPMIRRPPLAHTIRAIRRLMLMVMSTRAT